MRIRVNFTDSTESANINDVQQKLNGYIHKCLGYGNDYHDSISDYSISSLQNGKLKREYIDYKNPYIIISSNDQTFMSKIIGGMMMSNLFAYGMRFKNIEPVSEVMFNGWNNFFTLSPFLVKNKEGGFLTLDTPGFVGKLEVYLKNKLSKIDSDLDLTDFKVEIKEHNAHKVKKIMVKNVLNIANQCVVSIYCNKQVADILYNIGIGQSTGSGFGTICLVKNLKKYRN